MIESEINEADLIPIREETINILGTFRPMTEVERNRMRNELETLEPEQMALLHMRVAKSVERSNSIIERVRDRMANVEFKARLDENGKPAKLIEFHDWCVGIDPYEVLPRGDHYGKWLHSKGMRQSYTTPTMQEQYAQYKSDPEGSALETPSLNLWHVILKLSDFNNKSKTTSSRHSMKFKVNKDVVDEAPEWAQIVLTKLLAPYGGKVTLLLEVSR